MLPSGDLYSALLPERPDFSWGATLIVAFELKPEVLPSLVEEQNLTSETLNQFYRRKAGLLAQAAAELSLLDSSSNLMGPRWEKDLFTKLKPLFPELNLLRLTPLNMTLPDMDLYTLAKESYFSLVKSRGEARNNAAVDLAAKMELAHIEDEKERLALQKMKEYGELLTEYPILLQAIYVQQMSGSETTLEFPELKIPEILGSTPVEPR
jgi:hypothetical protein